MSYEIGDLIYEGKAKKIFAVKNHPDLLCLDYKNSLTAFNAEKKGEFQGKGSINQSISKIIFDRLEKAGIQHHLIEVLDDNRSVIKKLDIIPLEVVVRNRLAGSLARKFQMDEGLNLKSSLLEFYYKKDELGDPFVTAEQAVAMDLVPENTPFKSISNMAMEVNKIMTQLFQSIQLELIDFKLEFGQDRDGRLYLADEISPDSCRLWDMSTGEKMDKDRFRHDLGQVEESYREILNRLINKKDEL